ncbi:MAG: MotA/TolQ/ExbB proton channel family protein, partial [Cyanobium sp.]
MPGPIALLLLLLSIAVLTVLIDRSRFWIQWLRRRNQLFALWKIQVRNDPTAAPWQLEEWNREMAFGESLLKAAILLGPLLGLIGTVLGLMDVLAQLGPQLLLPANANLQG